MAEAGVQDVVNEAQSMGRSPVDVSGTTFTSHSTGGAEEQPTTELDPAADAHVTSTSASNDALVESDAVHPVDFASYAKFDHLQRVRSPETSLSSPSPADLHQDLSPSDAKSHVESDNLSAVDANLSIPVENASFAGSEDAGDQVLLGTDDGVGSDTDPAKLDGPDSAPDPIHRRERSNSVKKPASFKAVSVTKNFLAKSGASPLPSSRIASGSGDRASPASASSAAPPAALKPRLVAKSGRDARTLNTGNGIASGSGPDASTVWNRNRPAPPPPQKQFTDEELKQQYGIHMATRLQADEAGKESKWADIDDDEDDWAPETVQWMDGTKSTLLPSETQATPPPKSTGSPQPWKDSNEAAGSTSQSSQSQSAISSIGKTILRPGARVVATQSTKPGLILKSVPETQTQPEISQGTTSSSKSPWAPLPPVDKASPITFYPPATSTMPPMSSLRRDPSAPDEETRVLSPTREIAADDFDRSWRDGPDRSSRELFNSQSGRYEPVKNVRRSSRQDQGFRPPSVLQRPSQQNPAEPSAAFQSRETRSWSQRRDSSSYGSYERRVSVDHGSRHAAQSTSIASPHASPLKGDANLVTNDAQSNERHEVSATSPQQAYSAQVPEQNHVATGPEQDPRVAQQQLMRERIERNRKRKQEEEAREEAERKERIRLKMAALGPVSPKPAQSTPAETAQSENQQFELPAQEPTATPVDDVNSTKERAGSQPETDALKTESRPQFPSTKSAKEQGSKGSPSDGSIPATNNSEVQLPGLGGPMPTERQARSWGRVPQNMEPSANWGNKPLAQGSSNVWSPLTSDRLLGNGAFESEMNRMPSIQLPPNHQVAPGPLRAPSMSPRMHFDDSTPSPPPHMQTSTSLSPSIPQRSTFQQGQTRSTTEQSFQRQPQQVQDMGAAKRAWQNFPAQAASEEALLKEHAEREWAAKLAEEERKGGAQPDYQPVFRETFHQTVPGDVLGQRRVVSVTKSVQDGHGQGPYGKRSSSQSVPLQQTANGRASRFFGPGAERLPPVAIGHVIDEDLDPLAPASPPPPESAEHPVHGPQSRHPMVNIPKVLKVKLPPAAPNASVQRQDAVQMPSLMRYRTGHQPIVNQSAWQDRFNGLFNRMPKSAQPSSAAPSASATSPGQVPSVLAAAISSSTKASFDDTWAQNAATVSLPQGAEQGRSFYDGLDAAKQSIETKPTEEELVDEREFGSSPTVRLFKGIHPRVETITADCPLFHRGLVGNSQIAYFEKANKGFPASANALSFEYLDSDFFQSSGVRIRIRLCGKPTTMKILPRKVSTSSQVRKPKLRTQPKKVPLSGRVPRTGGAGANQVQEGSGTSSSSIKQMSGARPSSKPERVASTAESRTMPESKKSDITKVMSTASANIERANKTQEGTSGESPAASAHKERPKPGSQWAKPPKSQRRQRQDPVRA